MIPPHFTASVPRSIRLRGEAYCESGKVQLTHTGRFRIRARVLGHSRYRVSLSATRGRLTASCTCPYAANDIICKHSWAVLVCADRERWLTSLLDEIGPEGVLFAINELPYAHDLDPYGHHTDEQESELWDDEGYDDEDDTEALPSPPAPAPRGGAPRPTWKAVLDAARRQMEPHGQPVAAPAAVWPADRRLVYILDLPMSASSMGLGIELATERMRRDGAWEPPVAFRLGAAVWRAVPDPLDRQIAQMLVGAATVFQFDQPRTSGFVLRGAAIETTLPLMCATGRCRVRAVPAERPTVAVSWDDGPPWRPTLRIVAREGDAFALEAVLVREGEEMALSEPVMLHDSGFLIARGTIARFNSCGAFALVAAFRHGQLGLQTIEHGELPALLSSLLSLPSVPAIELPAEARIEQVRLAPTPVLRITSTPSPWASMEHVLSLGFRYGDVDVAAGKGGSAIFDAHANVIRHRNMDAECEARERLTQLGARNEYTGLGRPPRLTVPAGRLPGLVATVVHAGWRVESNGTPYRPAGATRTSVRSGVDWFELDAGVTYGDEEVSLHDLLEAKRAGASIVVLTDGSHGMLPLEWLARLAPIAAGGALVDGALRYRRTQALLLDALLAAVPEADVDATFATARQEMLTFDRVAPADPEPGFEGTLREYQREGLGWLHFLRRFQLGGCLADDMGLGKTVQVLALLHARHGPSGDASHPSLVVVPRSLVFNWMREAERFAPALRLLDHSGAGRHIDAIDSSAVDVVLTTYGTLRRDIAALAAVPFHYVVLDEAQAIKNSSSASAKAARLLKAEHRLAMSGTPIENRIEELWSLFEFLNPGMLGSASAFTGLTRLPGEGPLAGGRAVLAAALRPVILRRTKEQVATELPRRVEQTLAVELEGAQRKFYDGLLASYRRSVLEEVDRVGVGKSRMHILEALLRLRQAACHPVLADPRKANAPSAKLDALVPALTEVVAQGHKALVFSQFTSFLSLVRARLDAEGMRYEYLDGKVRDRQERVDRFQNDAECPVFLISLKAGGHGLNLTAADYVYILDPWWNPAVEAQAIDRAHRIGQTRHVMATRLVARNTIEEKILELQASKRALADAILGEDQGALGKIGREELEMLLG